MSWRRRQTRKFSASSRGPATSNYQVVRAFGLSIQADNLAGIANMPTRRVQSRPFSLFPPITAIDLLRIPQDRTEPAPDRVTVSSLLEMYRTQ